MEEKEYAGTYLIQQSFRVGRKHFVLGVDEEAAEKYLLAERHNHPLGIEYTDAIASNDYLEIAEEFSIRVHEEINCLREERAARKSDGIPFGQEACCADNNNLSYENQILILDPKVLTPEFRTKEEQLVLAISGFGCIPGRRSHKIYCRSLCDGEKMQIRGNDVLGIIDKRFIPKWANEKAATLRNAMQKERQVNTRHNNER